MSSDLAATPSSAPRNAQDRVAEFHQVFGLPLLPAPGMDPSRFELRLDLIREELAELEEGCDARDLLSICDALADLLYVVYGFGHELGLDLEAAVAEVHRSNMTKLWDSGTAEYALSTAESFPEERRPAKVVHLDGGVAVVYRSDGKVLKSPGWSEPDLSPFVAS